VADSLSVEDRQGLLGELDRPGSARTGLAKGWGIGLTIVKGVAEAHGGTVGVRADRDETAFTLCLPADARPAQSAAAASGAAQPLAPLRQ
jgi:signal transduction histidine kinase